VYFKGNAPSVGVDVFDGDIHTFVYYLPGTMNWGATFAGRPALLWNPEVTGRGGGIGVGTNGFGFALAGTSNLVVVIEACVDLAKPIWSPVGTNTLIDGASYFSDPQWTNYPARLYRIHNPFADYSPAAPWNAQIQFSDASFGVRTNRFGFAISGSSGLIVVVEACTNLANPVWFPVGTNTLTGGSSYFSDPQWTNGSARFYRLRAP